MENDKYPKEAWRRRCLMIVDPQTYWRIQYEAPEIASNQEVCVIDISGFEGTRLPFEVMGNASIRPGVLLVQSPYLNSIYADVAEAEARFAVAKHMSFCTFVGLLGAKKVTIKQVEIRNKDGSIKIDTTGTKGPNTGKFKAAYEEYKIMENEVKIVREFKGSRPDWQKAEQFLRERNLLGDAIMCALLESAKFADNPMRSTDLTMDLSNDSSSNLKLAASLSSMVGSLKIDLTRTTKDISQYSLTVHVEFP